MSIESPEADRQRSSAVEALRQNYDVLQRVRALVDDARIGILQNSEIPDAVLDAADFTEDPSSARAMWDTLREERAAILTVLLEDAWPTFHNASQSSETGLVEVWGNDRTVLSSDVLHAARNPLERLIRAFRSMVNWTMDDWQESREASVHGDTPMHANFRRLSHMLEFAKRHDITNANAAEYFKNGFSGAIQMHVGTTEVLPKVYRREYGIPIPPQEYASLLRASYHEMFSLPAHFDRSVGVPMMNRDFRQSRSSANDLELNPLLYTLKEGTLQRIDPVRLPKRALEMAHIGCSALHAKTPEGLTVHRATFNMLTKLTEDHHISRF